MGWALNNTPLYNVSGAQVLDQTMVDMHWKVGEAGVEIPDIPSLFLEPLLVTRGVFQKAGYATYPGKLTPHLTASVVATFPVSCCNIVCQLES